MPFVELIDYRTTTLLLQSVSSATHKNIYLTPSKQQL